MVKCLLERKCASGESLTLQTELPVTPSLDHLIDISKSGDRAWSIRRIFITRDGAIIRLDGYATTDEEAALRAEGWR